MKIDIQPSHKIGERLYFYDFEQNKIEELIINQITIKYGVDITLNRPNFNKDDISSVVLYRLGNKSYCNAYEIPEWDINRLKYFDSEEKLKQHLLGSFKKL